LIADAHQRVLGQSDIQYNTIQANIISNLKSTFNKVDSEAEGASDAESSREWMNFYRLHFKIKQESTDQR